jgi:DNA invertase Pin-like site-specific DNA recombinase
MSTLEAAVQEQTQRSLRLVPSPRPIASLVARQSRGDDGSMSIADQIDSMRAYCEQHEIEVGPIYEEPDVSGRKPLDKRHGLKRAVVDVEQNRSTIVLTAYFDRFCRSVATRTEAVQRVEAAGGEVHSLDFGRTSDATAVQKLNGTLLAAFAQYQAEQSGEKTVISKQRNIDRGVAPFPRITPAYQRRDDGTLEQHPHNAPLIREAAERRARGESYVSLVKWLNEQPLVHSYGKKIGEPLVMSVTGLTTTLASPLLYGEIRFGTFTPNPHAIDEPVIDRALARKLASAKSPRGRYSKSERLLARLGVLRCATCDSRMTVSTVTSNGKKYPYYICGNKLCERQAIVSATAAEDFVRDETIRLSADRVVSASLDVDVEAARVAREAAEQKLSRAIDMLSGLEDVSATREKLSELTIECDAAVAEHERLSRLAAPVVSVSTANWPLATVDERRDMITAVVARAVVTPGRGPGRIVVESALTS